MRSINRIQFSETWVNGRLAFCQSKTWEARESFTGFNGSLRN